MPMYLVTTMTGLLFTHELTKETENKPVRRKMRAELGGYAELHPLRSFVPKNKEILLLVLRKEAIMVI